MNVNCVLTVCLGPSMKLMFSVEVKNDCRLEQNKTGFTQRNGQAIVLSAGQNKREIEVKGLAPYIGTLVRGGLGGGVSQVSIT